MSILLKAIHIFNAITIKILWHFSQTRKNNPKICSESQKTLNNQSYLGRKKKSRIYHVLWLLAILQSYSNQNSMILAQKEMPQSVKENRELRNKPMNLWSVYDKGSKNKQWRKVSLFNMWYWENRTATCKRMKLKHSLRPQEKKKQKTQNRLKTWI